MVWEEALLDEVADGDGGAQRADNRRRTSKGSSRSLEAACFLFRELERSVGRANMHRAAPSARDFLILVPAQLPHAALVEQVALLL